MATLQKNYKNRVIVKTGSDKTENKETHLPKSRVVDPLHFSKDPLTWGDERDLIGRRPVTSRDL